MAIALDACVVRREKPWLQPLQRRAHPRPGNQGGVGLAVAVMVGEAVGLGAAAGCVGVQVGVGVLVDTRTMICAVGPTLPPASVSCTVKRESPGGKACGALIASQNCAVAIGFT